jgi:hypothetical protein
MELTSAPESIPPVNRVTTSSLDQRSVFYGGIPGQKEIGKSSRNICIVKIFCF